MSSLTATGSSRLAGMMLPSNALRTDASRRVQCGRPGIVDGPDAAGEDRLAEVAGALGRRRHRPDDRNRLVVVPLFVGTEREHLVLPDRKAERRPVHLQLRPLVVIHVLPGRNLDRGVRDRIQGRVPHEEIPRPVRIVGPRLHVQADDAAEAVAVLCVHAVLRHGDLLDGVHRGRVGGLETRAERHAVEQHVVGAPGAAARIVVVREGVVIWAVLVLGGPGHVDHRRVQVRQVVGIPAGHGHLVEHLFLEGQVRAARVELDHDRRRFDRHGFLVTANREHQIRGDVAALLHADVPLLRPLEAFQRGDDGIRARLHEVEQVSPLPVRDPVNAHPGRVVLQRDDDARQRSLAFIEDCPLHTRTVVLSAGRPGQQEHPSDDDPEPQNAVLHGLSFHCGTLPAPSGPLAVTATRRATIARHAVDCLELRTLRITSGSAPPHAFTFTGRTSRRPSSRAPVRMPA